MGYRLALVPSLSPVDPLLVGKPIAVKAHVT